MKKTIGIMVVVALAFGMLGMLSGCGDSEYRASKLGTEETSSDSTGASGETSAETSTLPASEVAGSYDFALMGVQTFTVQDASHLTVTDEEGASEVGSYDEKTGVFIIQDEGDLVTQEGEQQDVESLTLTYKVTFSRVDDGIKADMLFSGGDQVAKSFSAMKQ